MIAVCVIAACDRCVCDREKSAEFQNSPIRSVDFPLSVGSM
jgi:hypothetical protein